MSIGDSAYESDWFNRSNSLHKIATILIIQTSSTMEISLGAYKFAELSLVLFSEVRNPNVSIEKFDSVYIHESYSQVMKFSFRLLTLAHSKSAR